MKNFSFLFISTLLLFSCSKSELAPQYGKVSLSIEQGAKIFIDQTKAVSTIPDEYHIITTTSSGTQVDAGTGTYGTVKNAFTVEVGTGYKISAFNISETEAKTANSNWGAQRFFGNSTFDVTAGATTNVTFTCTMVNSKVSIGYDLSFTSQFSNYSVNVYAVDDSGRKLTFTDASDLTSPIAYFNIEGSKFLNIVVKGTRKLDSTAKEFNSSITLTAASWHKLTIKASTSSGNADLDISVDNTVVELSSDVIIDPYQN